MIIPGQNPNAPLDTKHWVVQNSGRIYEQFSSYLSEFDISSRDLLTDNDPSSQKELIFLAVIRDFINFHISFDMFGSLLGELWMTVEKNFNFSQETPVEVMCHYGFELQWYLRNAPEKHIDWLTEILDYYEKNKSKIE